MKNLYLLLLLLGSNFIFAQSTIRGQVSDAQQEPISFANVLLFSPDSTFVKGTITEIDGRFLFKKIEKGSYYLKISMLGYNDEFSPIFNIDQKPPLFEFQLEDRPSMLAEVDIVAKKPLFEQQVDRTVVNVQNSVTASGSTALTILERSPGIQVDRMNAQISMQGKQGVIVMLNGKRMRVDAQTLIQLLESMPSDNIEKMELITTPPASYDAEGDAGIINIQTIKKEDEGFNGNLSLNSGYGLRPKFGGTFNINFRKGPINLFADLSANNDYSIHNTRIFRRNEFEEQVTTLNIDSHRPAFTGLYNGRLGLDYELSEKTTIGVLLSAYYRHWDLEASTNTQLDDSVHGSSSATLFAAERNDWKHAMANINLRHRFDDDSQLSIDFDVLHYLDDNPVQYQEQFFDAQGIVTADNPFTSVKSTPINFQVAKIDYQKQWTDALKLEMGVKGTLSDFTNDVQVDRFIDNEWQVDARFTDVFRLDEKIGAAYISADYKWSEKLTAKAGLRYEYYDSDLKSDEQGDLVVQKFGRLFPTLFLTYQISENNQLQLSYNERITRPEFNTIAPAFFFWDSNTILAGNPTIRPTISRRLSLGIRHKSTMLNIQIADDENPIAFQPEILAEENIVLTKAVNMADAQILTISFNTPIQFTSWWESRYNATLIWHRMQPIVDGQVITRNGRYFTGNINQNFKLPKDFNFEINANWNSNWRYALAQGPMRASINLGVQKSFGDCKLTLNWNDIFDWGSFFDVRFDQPDFNMLYRLKYNMEGNVIRLNFTWNFGNSKLKKAAARSTGSEEERNRLNNN